MKCVNLAIWGAFGAFLQVDISGCVPGEYQRRDDHTNDYSDCEVGNDRNSGNEDHDECIGYWHFPNDS